MKKIILLFTIIAFSCSSGGGDSDDSNNNSNNPDDPIIGTWLLVNEEILSGDHSNSCRGCFMMVMKANEIFLLSQNLNGLRLYGNASQKMVAYVQGKKLTLGIGLI